MIPFRGLLLRLYRVPLMNRPPKEELGFLQSALRIARINSPHVKNPPPRLKPRIEQFIRAVTSAQLVGLHYIRKFKFSHTPKGLAAE